MNYAKLFALAAMALTVLIPFAGTASASRVTSPPGTLYTGTIKATSTDTKWTNSSTIGTVSCEHSEMVGTVKGHGSSATAIVSLSTLTFSKCTGGEPTSPVGFPGSLELHLTTAPNGTTTSSGAVVIIHKTLVGSCSFRTNEKPADIGTFTGGTPAKLDIGSSPIPQGSNNMFCPSSANLSGTYTFTSPGSLLLS
ncbi:MAG TPA: hypothetical protein VFJ61_13475 [Solirubrobacterales bacterium]|nr:hypothetical protein [Solirubrobacterales bacterium]